MDMEIFQNVMIRRVWDGNEVGKEHLDPRVLSINTLKNMLRLQDLGLTPDA